MRPEKQLVKNTWLHAEKYNFGYCLYLVSNNQTDLDITWAFIAVLQSTYRLRKLFCAKAQIFLPDIFSGAHSKMQLSIIQKQCGQWNIIPKVPSAAIRCFHPTFTGSTQAHTNICWPGTVKLNTCWGQWNPLWHTGVLGSSSRWEGLFSTREKPNRHCAWGLPNKRAFSWQKGLTKLRSHFVLILKWNKHRNMFPVANMILLTSDFQSEGVISYKHH